MIASVGAPQWRTECQVWARQQTVAEARDAWNLPTAEQIPFNYRWEHVQQVVRLARWLAHETTADLDIVEAAAWLHDVSKGEPKHGVAGAKQARTILGQTDFPQAKIDGVAVAIAVHVGLYRPEDASPLSPIDDVRASAGYRLEAALTLLRRSLVELGGDAA